MNDLTERLGDRVYLDANIFIYALEGAPALTRPVGALLEEIERSGALIIGSEILLPELLAKPLRLGDEALVASYKSWLLETPQIRIVPVSENVIWRATALRAAHGLKTVDALHLATALEHGCESFVSNDRAFPDLDNLRVFDLSRDFGEAGGA